MLTILSLYALAVLGYLTLNTPGSGQPYTLATGVQTLLWSGAAAGASTTIFNVQPRGDGGGRNLTLQAEGAAGVLPTTITANVEGSIDGGTTWAPVGTAGTAIALVATTNSTAFGLTNLGAGTIYRVNVTTCTLGNAASAIVVGTLS